MRRTLQEMVAGAISVATEREKIAQVVEPPKNESGTVVVVPEEVREDDVKCASAPTDLVEKVASALDFINDNMDAIDWEKVAVGKPMPAQGSQGVVSPTGGPAAGAGSLLPTTMDSPTPGMQSEQTGRARNNQPEAAGLKDDVGKTDGQTNAETALLTDMRHVPGGTGEQPQLHQEGNLPVLKKASINAVRARWAELKKHAADAENPAKINAGTTPLKNPDATAAEEGVPKLPAPAQAQANLVQTTDPTAPANITKQQAKAEPKRQMGEVLSEPAQRKSTDPVLHQNLDAASQAGVKLSSVQAAAARTYLRKLAQAGESDGATPEEKEKAEKLKAAVAKKKEGKEKEKESQMGAPMPTQSPTSVVPPPSTPSM